MDYTKYNYNNAKAASYDEGMRSYMLGIYNYMAVALIITGIVALFAASSPALLSTMYVLKGNQIVGYTGFGLLIGFAPLGFSLAMSFGFNRMSAQTLHMLLLGFATVMGLSLTSLLLRYTGDSVARIFFITASIFGAMSIYGYSTKKDLTSMGSFLYMGVMGILVASLVNMFLKSSGLYYVLSFVSVLVFTGLTAYDTQKLKSLYYNSGVMGDQEMSKKISIMGALTLYMDFIVIFTHLLQLFGNRRDN
jgi:FtsH-binding integral membrane protein